MLLPRHVLRLFDRLIDPPGRKRVICVSPERRLFLRINSHPWWPPYHTLEFSPNKQFLEYESYVEISRVYRYDQQTIQTALHDQGLLGRLSIEEATALAWAAQKCRAMSGEYQRMVWERLTAA